MPASTGEIEPSDWEYIEPEIDALAVKISATTDRYREQVRSVKPELPAGCENRLRERWRPLKRVASVAGDHWANVVDQLVIRDIENERELADNGETHVSVNLQIVRDLYKVFAGESGHIPTKRIVMLLITTNPDYWSVSSTYGKDLTPQRFGQILTKAFGIYSQRDNENPRGYCANQFEQIWSRFGIAPSKPTEPTEPTESDLF
jgi:hypothetical protein